MVGSRDSIASPNIVLNTIVAEAFSEACDELEQAENFDEALNALIARYAKDHHRIIFNGDGYSEEWVKEAERRGLPNIESMVEAIPALESESSVRVFEKFHVFTEAELKSRVEIKYENYAKVINIEARTMIDMASKQILPAIVRYTKTLADTVNAVKAAGVDADVQMEVLREVSTLLKEVRDALVELKRVTEEATKKEVGKEQAEYFRFTVFPAMKALRVPVDALEMIVDKEAWPMPSYGDLMFEV